jgi:DNA-binding NtrC family response regulator
LLAHRFAARAAADLGKPAALFAPDAIDALERYDWPGNVRELAHAIERAVLLSGDAVIRATSFDQLHPTKLARTESPLDRQAVEPSSALLPSESLDLAEIETAAIARALQLTGQNRSRAAKLLGIDVRTLRKKLNGHSRADRTSTPASD